MELTRREKIREATREEIKETAWKQIAESGAASLSLRAIAREMGLTAPALYRYYPSRDDLVTGLIIDAFNSFADELESARDDCPEDDHAARFRAICHAYRSWALTYPQRYVLLFGMPVSGYQMGEQAYPSARRSFLVLQNVVGEAYSAGALSLNEYFSNLPEALNNRIEKLHNLGMPYTPVVTELALSTWGFVHGLTSLELYGYLPMFLENQSINFFQFEVDKFMRTLGLI